MSAKEEDVHICLMNLKRNLEWEKYLRKEILKFREETYEFWISSRRHKDDTADKYLELMEVRKEIMRQRKEYVSGVMNKKVISISNSEELEAIIFLKREGWKGKALVYHSKNNPPFILGLTKEQDSELMA